MYQFVLIHLIHYSRKSGFLACNYEEEQLQDSGSNDSNSCDEHVSCAKFVDSVDINSFIDSSSCILEISKITPGPKDLA